MRRSVLLLALVVAACGGSSTQVFDTTTTTTSTTTTTTSPSTTTTTTSTTTTTTTTTTLPPTTSTAITGLQEIGACRLPDLAFNGVGIGFPRSTERLQPIGDVQVAVLFTDFADAPAVQTPQEIYAHLDGVEEFFEAVSYGRLRVELFPHFEWLRMSGPVADYAASITSYEEHKDWIEEAAAAADPVIDFSGVDEIVVIATPQATAIPYGPTWTGGEFTDGWIELDGERIYNGVTSGYDLLHWGYLWLPHEMGHSLSFVDLYAFEGPPDGFTRPFSLMDDIASEAPEYLAWERWHAGWLDDDQILCVDGGTTATITPIEETGGVKALVVPIHDTRAVVVESRRAIGYDTALSREGAVAYVVDTAIASGYGPVQVLNDRRALRAGDSIEFEYVTITVVESTEVGDTVQVVVG